MPEDEDQQTCSVTIIFTMVVENTGEEASLSGIAVRLAAGRRGRVGLQHHSRPSWMRTATMRREVRLVPRALTIAGLQFRIQAAQTQALSAQSSRHVRSQHSIKSRLSISSATYSDDRRFASIAASSSRCSGDGELYNARLAVEQCPALAFCMALDNGTRVRLCSVDPRGLDRDGAGGLADRCGIQSSSVSPIWFGAIDRTQLHLCSADELQRQRTMMLHVTLHAARVEWCSMGIIMLMATSAVPAADSLLSHD